MSSDPCKYGVLCRVASCGKDHPRVNPAPCRFGEACWRAQCTFSHPATRNVCLHEGQCRVSGCSRLHPPGFVGTSSSSAAGAGKEGRSHGTRALAVRPPATSPSTALVAAVPRVGSVAVSAASAMAAHSLLGTMPGAVTHTESYVRPPKEVTTKKRHRTNVVVVLDVSRSMAGGKLASACQSILDLVAQCLRPSDTLTVHVFSDELRLLLPVSKLVAGAGGAGGAGCAGAGAGGRVKKGGLPTFTASSLAATLGTLCAGGRTKLFDAIVDALDSMEAESDAYHSQAAAKFASVKPRYMQLVVVTDGEDTHSAQSAVSVRARLERPGAWAGRCHFRACLVGVGESASRVLREVGDGLKPHVHVIGGEDGAEGIKAAFKRVVETMKFTLTEVVSTTVTTLKQPAGAGAGRTARGVHRLEDRKSG